MADAPGGAQRRDAGVEQAFGRVDVADADDQVTVHQQGLDRCFAPAGQCIQPLAVEGRIQRFDAQHGEQRVTLDLRPLVPEHAPEAAGVAQTQDGVREQQVEMVVLSCRRTGRDQAQAARHAEVEDQPAAPLAAGKIEQQVLAAPHDGFQRQAREALRQSGRNFRAQAGRAHHRAKCRLAGQMGEQAQAADFDFGEFGHLLRPAKVHNMLGNHYDASASKQDNRCFGARKEIMKAKYRSLLAAVLALGFTVPAQADGGATPSVPAAAPVVEGRQAVLTAQVVYQVLLAEIALQRGNAELAAQAYAALALRTRDPGVLERTVEVAGHARRFDLAREAVQLWLQVDPESAKAQRMMSSVLLMSNRLEEMAPHLVRMLELDKAALPENLLGLNRMLARNPDRQAVFRLIDRVCAPFFGLAEAHYAVAMAAASAGEQARARAEIQRALELRPDWEMAALLAAQIEARDSPAAGVESLLRFLETNPEARDVRLHLARALIAEKRYPEARTHFDRLLRDHPDNPEVVYPVAILALQQNDVARAEVQLRHLLTLDFPDKNVVHFYLGQIAEEGKRPADALAAYAQVVAGEHRLAARLRGARLLGEQGKLEEARAHVRETRALSPADRVQLILAEAQLLRDAKRHREAYEFLEKALGEQPAQPELLYETALLAEKLGQLDVLERHLRRLIELQPDSAQAYNALGYSLADRNIRLPEAHELIAKALALAPEDPFILDSMGWVLYRTGDLAGALAHLERAYGQRPDPEIAAHLGEVLWQLGRRDEARRTWRDAAARNPDNEVLSEALRKFSD